jgi:hypothetical protein
MLTQVIWWTANLLEAVLLGRASWQKFIKAYPLFYTYLAFVLLTSLSRFYMYVWHAPLYTNFYWATQGVSVFLGFAVVWEICRQALAHYPGAFRMVRTSFLIIFVIVSSKIIVNVLVGESWSLAATIAEEERDFRVVQAFLLLVMAGLISFYRIQIGRNLRGMMLGFGFFIGTSVLNLTIRSYFGDAFQIWWQYLQPAAFVVVLLIWCVTLWSYWPNPEPEVESRIEQDYHAIVRATRQRFRQARAHVGRAVRP